MNDKGCGERVPGVESAADPGRQSAQTERQAITATSERIKMVAGREEIVPINVALTDSAELIYPGGRKSAHLISLIGATSKFILAWAVGDRAVTDLAVLLWERPQGTLKAEGVASGRVTLHHHQDSILAGYLCT